MMYRRTVDAAIRIGSLKHANRICSVGAVGAIMALCAAAVPATTSAKDLKVGAVLGLSQVMSIYGNAIVDGFNFAVEEAGGEVAGRKILLIKEDDKNDPRMALQLTRRMIKDEKVDFIIGPVASHVAAAMREDIHNSKTFWLVANAGNDELTRDQCSPYIIRSSFSNWQWNSVLGDYSAKNIGKRAALVAYNYAAGKQMGGAFASGFKEAGGTIVAEEWPAMGMADFSSVFTKMRGIGDQVDVVWSFIPGSGTVNFVNQYAQAGLKPVRVGPQSNADETFFNAMKDNALGVIGSSHYAVSIKTPRNIAFVEAYKKKYNRAPNVTDLQGYDSGRLIIDVVRRLKGDLSNKQAVRDAFIAAEIDSPRGYFKIDPRNGNPIQNIYITKVVKSPEGYAHEVVHTYEKVRDPDNSCKLSWQ